MDASSSSRGGYDVFLSFRGEDTRNNFTGHLYDALIRKGVNAFIDAEKLGRGQEISPSLFTAIESSIFSIIVLSEDYASSRWCLVELVKILDCMKARGQLVLPIFYNVGPSDIRNHRGKFGEAFNQLAQSHDTQEVQVWRDALARVANLSGWDSRNKHEPSLIQEIVGDVFNRLLVISSNDVRDLVGMESHFRKMESLLSVGSNDVRFIGIWGMGGIGKTTIARFVYDQIKEQFEAHCFLSNVREESQKHGLFQLQKELLYQLLAEENLSIRDVEHGRTFIQMRLRLRRVLIVIDDVNDEEQLDYLSGKHHWYGTGSRIIITTKDMLLLEKIRANGVYEVEELYRGDALKLFSQHAFQEDHPKEGYMELSNGVVSYAQGLPLALKVLGSSLFGRSVREWRDLFNKLKMNPPLGIVDVLRVSFDGLDDAERDIFLDVACFFKGDDKDFVVEILDGCGFFPHIGIRVLIEKALITLVDNKLWMHDLLQEMGWDIVCRTSHKSPGERLKLDPGKRTRLWFQKEVDDVLMQKTGTESIEGIFVNWNGLTKMHFTTEAFVQMKKLRLLKVYNSQTSGGFECVCASRKKTYRKPISPDFEFPSYTLSYLHWSGCPLQSLPPNFHPKNLVHLNLSCGYIEKLWKGAKPLEKLKFLDLTHCRFLKKIPDLSSATKLERLVLEGCIRLGAVDPSLGRLKKLTFLSLKDCLNLRKLPSLNELEYLKHLIVSGCPKVRTFPGVRGQMQHLMKLHLDGTGIEEVPSSIDQYAPGLVEMDLRNCKKLKNLPNGLCNLESLETLLISGCSKLVSLPHDFGKLKGLKNLQADRTGLRGLPDSFAELRFTLLNLSFSGCSIDFLFPHLPTFHLLKSLDLSDCNIVDGMQLHCLSLLSSLRTLDLSRNNFELLPSSFSRLSQLLFLHLVHCRRLQALPELPSRIGEIFADDCKSLRKIPNLPPMVTRVELTNCLELEDSPIIIRYIFEKAKPSAIPEILLKLVSAISAIIPGSGIPEWFSHQNEGDTVYVTPYSNMSPSNFLGLALCVVLHPQNVGDASPICYSILPYSNIYFYCSDRLLKRDSSRILFSQGIMESDHIWLGYLPSSLPRHCDNVKISFSCLTDKITTTSCGVRLIYTEDVNERSSAPQPSSSIIIKELENLLDEDIESDTD